MQYYPVANLVYRDHSSNNYVDIGGLYCGNDGNNDPVTQLYYLDAATGTYMSAWSLYW